VAIGEERRPALRHPEVGWDDVIARFHDHFVDDGGIAWKALPVQGKHGEPVDGAGWCRLAGSGR